MLKQIQIIILVGIWQILLTTSIQAQEIKITNSLSKKIQNKVLAISRTELEKATSIPANKYPNLGKKVLTLLDEDGDEAWDALLVLVDLEPNETLNLKLNWLDQAPATRKMTNIRMAKVIEYGKKYEEVNKVDRISGTDTKITTSKFQMEGPGWENDKVGFRNYLDERNGFDIFGKTTSKMVMDKVGINQNYHKLQDWGMDILKVGNSLGSGSLAILYQDSLYRVTAPSDAYFELVDESALRSTFNLVFDKVKIGSQFVKVKQQISITAGQYAYASKVYTENLPKGAQIVPGIVKLHSDSLYIYEAGNKVILATHDKQAFNEEYLGMALVVDKANYQGWLQTPEKGKGITSTYAVKLRAKGKKPIKYDFYACWELRDKKFAQRDYFIDLVKEQYQEEAIKVEIQ